MRVLVVIHSLRRGGGERVAIDIALGLQARGHAVRFALLLGTNEYSSETTAHEIASLLRAEDYRWPWSVPAMARALGRIWDDFGPDVVQIHTPTAAVVTAWTKRRRPAQHVIHGYGTIARPPSVKGYLARRLDRWAERKLAPRLTVVANSMSAVAAKYFGQPVSAISCVPNGVDVKKFAFVKREVPRAPIILTVGTLSQVKRPDLAIAAMPALIAQLPHTRLLIAGDGPLRDALRRQIEGLGLRKSVELLGRREDIPSLMTRAHLFWHLSESEGLPLAVAEAMASGLPVIGHDVRGTREVVADGETGFLVPFADGGSLVAHSLRLLNDGVWYAKISRNASERAAQFFSAERMLGEHEALLYGLMRSRSAVPSGFGLATGE